MLPACSISNVLRVMEHDGTATVTRQPSVISTKRRGCEKMGLALGQLLTKPDEYLSREGA